MGKDSRIEWTHHTFNPWRGCTKATWVDAAGKVRLHPGCLNCYAEVDYSVKMHGIKWGKGQERKPKAESGWKEPLAWARAAARAGERHQVFTASLSDVLDPEVPDSMRSRLWDTIRKTAILHNDGTPYDDMALGLEGLNAGGPGPHGLDWLILTKRPEEWKRVPEDVRPLVWFGTSASEQPTLDEWGRRLMQAQGFRYRFLSLEPLLGHVDLTRVLPSLDGFADHGEDGPVHKNDGGGVSWVIVGGESGPKARPCNVDWIRSIVRQCAEVGVPCFVKQLGAFPHHNKDSAGWAWNLGGGDKHWLWDEQTDTILHAYHQFDAKGGDWGEWPEDLRVRQLPK